MRTIVETRADGRYRVWDGRTCTQPLEIDELERQLQSMARGVKFYPLKTEAEWYAADAYDLDRVENPR